MQFQDLHEKAEWYENRLKPENFKKDQIEYYYYKNII